MQQKMSLILPYEFEIVFKSLPPAEAGRLILAIYSYEQRKEPPNFSDNPMLQFAWETHIKPKIDENVERYDATCKARRIAGSKGGRPQQNNQEKPKKANGFFANQNNQMVSEKAKEPDCDCDCDYDCDCEINKEKPNQKESPEKKDDGWGDVLREYDQRFPMTMSSFKSQQLSDILANYGKEAVLFAIREASSGNAKQPIPYIRSVAMNYSRQKENDQKVEPRKESLEEIGERITAETEKARAEGRSMTPEQMKRKVLEEMKRKGMKIVGTGTDS